MGINSELVLGLAGLQFLLEVREFRIALSEDRADFFGGFLGEFLLAGAEGVLGVLERGLVFEENGVAILCFVLGLEGLEFGGFCGEQVLALLQLFLELKELMLRDGRDRRDNRSWHRGWLDWGGCDGCWFNSL